MKKQNKFSIYLSSFNTKTQMMTRFELPFLRSQNHVLHDYMTSMKEAYSQFVDICEMPFFRQIQLFSHVSSPSLALCCALEDTIKAKLEIISPIVGHVAYEEFVT